MIIEIADLRPAFCAECAERLQRAEAVLRERQGALTAKDYDRLYQEFDSLFGGARAAGIPELELLFRSMAAYVRWLKRRGPAGISERRRELIAAGIALGRKCGGAWSDCLRCCPDQINTFTDEMNTVMAEE